MSDWSDWKPFPDPREKEYLSAPFGPGVYELRRRSSGDRVLFGRSGNVAYRISTLLPKPLGCGSRNNTAKREYVLANIGDLDYHTFACGDSAAAKELEKEVKHANTFIFET